MAWNQTLANLRDVLADLYLSERESVRVVSEAGLKPVYIDFEGSAVTRWHSILRYADHNNRVADIVNVAQEEYPGNQWLDAVMHGNLTAVRGPDIETEVEWGRPTDASGLEKLMGDEPTFLPIAFLEMGSRKAKAVAKIVCQHGSGTGFLTANDLLITNHHVLADAAAAAGARAIFNYQKTADGLDAEMDEYALAPQDAFATSAADDWSIVRVSGQPSLRHEQLELARVELTQHDRVIIVQHPGGGYKQVAFYHNVIAFVGRGRVQYYTDTLPGSSGSPVFDHQWRVVALHHSGGWLREPGTQKSYYRNEGIHINTVMDGLVSAGLR